MKHILTLLLMLLIISQGTSQFSLGGQFSYLKLTGGSNISTIGAGIKGEKLIRDKTALVGGFNYFKTSTFADMATLQASSSTTDPSQITITLDYDISFFYFYAGGKRYLIGDYGRPFGLYADIEAGLLMAPTTSFLGEYDKSLYNTFRNDIEKETLANFTMGLGLGIEKSVGFGYLYAGGKVILPATQSNGVTIDYEIPISYMFTAGIRVPFGS